MKQLLYFTIFIISSCIYAENISEKISLMEKKIAAETERLNSFREQILKEREPLKNELYEKEKELLELRFKVRQANAFDSNVLEGFTHLKDEVSYLESEVDFIADMLKDYRRNLAKNLSLEEEQSKSADFKIIDDFLDASDKTENFKAFNPLFTFSINKLKQRFNNYSFKGVCLNKEGIEKKGVFYFTGPVSFFIADDSSEAGLTAFNIDKGRLKIEKSIEPLLLKELSEGKEVSLPFDVTLGTAKNTESLKKNFIDHMKQGGVVIIPILMLGIICILVIIIKIFTLSGIGKVKADKLNAIVELVKNDDDKALDLINQLKTPYASVIREGFIHRKDPREHIEDLMHEKTLTEIPYLEKWLSVLAVSAAASPLLGLLGTVTGMIHTFDLITLFGTGKANLLSAGISEALVTTEFGLIIAIPALIFHAFFSRKVKHIINNIDTLSLSFINKIKAG